MTALRRIARRRDLLSLFAIIFLTDLAIGIYRTTFSLFADSLGVRLAVIGTLGGMEGLVRILVSMPIGMLSDRLERRKVLAGGLLLFALTYALTSVVTEPLVLYLLRAMIGISVASTFYIGVALIGDRADAQDQGLSIGIYTTCMGIGFAVGSGVGGRLAEDVGFRTGFVVASGVVLLALALLRWGPAWRTTRSESSGEQTRLPLSAQFKVLVKNPVILAACLGHLGISMSNEGATFGFFPLYAASLGAGKAMIGAMFSIRMIMSAGSRIPTGVLASGFRSRYLMTGALLLGMSSVLGMGFVSHPVPLTLLLAGEGVAFGVYFASASTAIAQNTEEKNRGAATGLFTTTGSVGSTVGPVGLGRAAEQWGLSSVFWITSAVLAVGLLVNSVFNLRAEGNASVTGENTG